MTNESTRNGAVGWDPKSPATLYVAATVSDYDDGGNSVNDNFMNINYVLSQSGVGCNTFESSAIMNLLDARDKFLEVKSSSESGCQKAVLRLSRQYRKALAGCIENWRDDCSKKKDGEEKDDEIKREKKLRLENVSLELLQVSYAVTHLTETFLILPNMMQQDIIRDGIGGSTYYEDIWKLPGAITADTIRYLRLHHLGDAEDQFDEDFVENLHTLWQPEQYNDGEDYWMLIEAYVIRGCLEDAWALLSHHSIVRRFAEMQDDDGGSSLNDYEAALLAKDLEGFQALKNILLSAPLPGNRNNGSDEGFDENYNVEENDHISDRSEEDNVTEAFMVEEEFIEGVPTDAYRLWETSKNCYQTGDYPVNYEPYAADQVYKYWKNAIYTIPALQSLRRRNPQLNKLLELISGNFTDVEFNSWQEELCAELLYKTPNIRLDDMNIRTGTLMAKYSDDKSSAGLNGINNMILTVMKGNAGEAIKVLHELGGGSGAALPAVMTSLLRKLLADAKILSHPFDNYNLENELLIEASSAIRSSLATEGCHDLGTRLAVRLLLSYITIDSDVRITASLADTLEHHSPKSDAEAQNLLSLCRKLIERKNIRILDGCSSICVARYLYYIRDRRPGGAVHWLLTGIELESLVLCSEGGKLSQKWQKKMSSGGSCYQRLVAFFTETSRSLLKMILGDEKGASLFYVRAKEMVLQVRKDESNIASFIPAVKVLEHTVAIAGGVAEKGDHAVVANSIISCLEEKPNDEDDGVVSSLARSLRWDLLRLAIEIVKGDVKRAEIQDKNLVSSFDVKGLGILLSCFTIELKVDELNNQRKETNSPEEILRMRLILAEGLKRAFIAENSFKKLVVSRRSKANYVDVYGANFSKHTREEQELAVEMMLEY